MTEKLEKYLEGELSEKEKNAFEAEMKTDPALAEKVWLHQQLATSLGNREEIEVEERLKLIMIAPEEKEQPTPPKSSFSYRPYLIGIAASLILLLGIRLIFFSAPTMEEIYGEHYAAYDASKELRSETGIPKNLLSTAFDSYLEEDFQTANTAFEEILVKSPGNPRALFYLGICQLELSKTSNARTSFEAVLAEAQNLYLTQASWYLAMSCLKLNDSACATTQLAQLSSEPGRYRSKAKKALEQMKKNKEIE